MFLNPLQYCLHSNHVLTCVKSLKFVRFNAYFYFLSLLIFFLLLFNTTVNIQKIYILFVYFPFYGLALKLTCHFSKKKNIHKNLYTTKEGVNFWVLMKNYVGSCIYLIFIYKKCVNIIIWKLLTARKNKFFKYCQIKV